MNAPCLRIDVDSANFETVNCSCHADMRSLGQISTSTDPITKQMIISANPVLNEPVRSLKLPNIFGPTNPPMLAVQLMNPTAAAAAALVRNSEGKLKKAGK